eukprot:jgi/Astpho2/3643/fgenesh1_pg.00059_%23_5_t
MPRELGPFKIREKVLVPHTDKYYEARALKSDKRPDGEWYYFIHYPGWDKQYDEWVVARDLVKWDEKLLKVDLTKESTGLPQAMVEGEVDEDGSGKFWKPWLAAVCFLSGVPEQGCKAEACIPAAWGPADSTNMAEAAAGALPSASALRALPSPMRRYWMWLGPHIAAGISSAWCTRDQRFCCAGLAQASTVPLDQGSVQAEGLSPSEAVREMDSACKRRERDRERRKRKREQAAAVAVADGTALHGELDQPPPLKLVVLLNNRNAITLQTGSFSSCPFASQVELDLPPPLKLVLLNDHDAVTQQGKLAPAPREPCVDQVLSQYLAQCSGSADQQHEVVYGVQQYFNKAFQHYLLYDEEVEDAAKVGVPVQLHIFMCCWEQASQLHALEAVLSCRAWCNMLSTGILLAVVQRHTLAGRAR